MGWLTVPGVSRRTLIDRETDSDETVRDGVLIRRQCLARCYRGGKFSGVLWTVWEFVYGDGRSPYRFIGADLLRYVRVEEGWSIKHLREADGPLYHSCPLKYLRMVPDDSRDAQSDWRIQVRESAAKRAAARAKRKGQA